jgi:hypothetical protein
LQAGFCPPICPPPCHSCPVRRTPPPAVGTGVPVPAPAAVRRRGPASKAPQRGQPLAESPWIRRRRPAHPDARRFSHNYLPDHDGYHRRGAAEALRQAEVWPLRRDAGARTAAGVANYGADDSCPSLARSNPAAENAGWCLLPVSNPCAYPAIFGSRPVPTSAMGMPGATTAMTATRLAAGTGQPRHPVCTACVA